MTVPALTLMTITPLSGSIGLMLTPYSARGLDQTLEPITVGTQVRRDINGNAMDLTYSQFRKYASTITCMDLDAPVFDDVWLGQVVDVECTIELRYLTSGGSPGRPVVSGSSRDEGNFTYYRPLLTMIITGIRNRWSEWKAEYQWQIDLQEV